MQCIRLRHLPSKYLSLKSRVGPPCFIVSVYFQFGLVVESHEYSIYTRAYSAQQKDGVIVAIINM